MVTNMSAPQQGNQDYLDKAFAAGAKKFGGAQGQKVAGNRAMSEKITDGMRKAFEKVTGKKVSAKISN
ncbi:Unconventional myosin-IXa [Pyrenophora seminiperda CCB06]|uniref:Unconventional myosin-IXa n=1 Tax=Pyrenophora seminiperda CCB06 TaxID=1302712 RepID=A0A3M7M6N6_9PLEO|nr:Unconventional myosin-IXa [Pyrenophora seminiperda CCB06]